MPYTPYRDIQFQTRYQIISAPQARTDGSGCVDWDVRSQVSADAGVTWNEDAHWTVRTPGRELEAVLVLQDSTGALKQTKNAAAKALLVANRNTQPIPMAGYDAETIMARQNANGLAAAAATGINQYITVTLNQAYPVAFNL